MPVNNDMTIEETIEHLDQIAKNQLECADKIDELHCDSTSTRNMASYHKQLAEWLKELKAYRDTYKNYSKIEKMLICEVEKAKENPSVKKPISYGLYQTWKFWDKNEVVREVNADED